MKQRFRDNLPFIRENFPKLFWATYHLFNEPDWLRRFPEWQTPEPQLYDLKLPEHVDTIFDVGCGNGRNLVPFRSKLKLKGIDLVPKDSIEWVVPADEVEYEQCSVEEFVKRTPFNMTDTLVYSHNALYLLSEKTQNDFYDFCKRCGCKNFLFEEFYNSTHHPTEYFRLPTKDFFISQLPDETVSFSQLDV